jgi:Fic family protein/DNA-binding XRE family transcriptional regulator
MNYRTQLTSILKASGWSQEQLARALGVSFPTLNSWVNGRSEPRARAITRIQELYLETIGTDNIDLDTLDQTKAEVVKLQLTAKELLKNTDKLDKLTLHLTYHTNTIEGSTMTLSDVEEVIFEHKVLTNRTAIEQAEARNHQAALYWLIEQLAERGNSFSVTEELILGLHLRLMNGISGDTGQYRSHAVSIMGANVPPANYVRIPEFITQLVDDIRKPQADIVQGLATTHASFEKIHPFSDGNGRTGRLIMLAQALHAGFVPPLVAKERKQAYYKYLEAAQLRGVHGPLELFVAESMVYTDKLLKENK